MQIGVGFFLLGDGRGRGRAVIVPRVDDGLAGKFHDNFIKGMVLGLGVASGKVTAAAAVDKNRIAGNQMLIDEKTLASRRMARCMKGFDFEAADF